MLVEREKPLSALLDCKNGAAAGRGSIALVSGEAGVGKTSLLHEFRNRICADIRLYWSGCDALFTPKPLGPIHEIAHSLPPEIRNLLQEGDGSAVLFSALVNELETKASVFVIEDVHWADFSTLDFLAYFGKRVSLLPTLLVLSFRNDEVVGDHPLRKVIGNLPQSNIRRMELTPLSKNGVAALCAGGPLDSEKIYSVSQGNPFFVTEIIAAGTDRLDEIPASVKDAVTARLSRLGAGEQQFLETISVIPGAVPQEILKPLFSDDGEIFAMACVGRKLLLQDINGSLKFRHELARLATLARLTSTEQKAVHQKILNAFSEAGFDPGIDQRVHHASGAMDGALVLKLAPDAAMKAAASGAHCEAASHFGTALEFIDQADPELAASLYEGWAYEAGLADRIDDEVIDARKHALTLWRVLERPDKVGENLRWLSRLHWYRGESAKAQRYADEAVRILETAALTGERAMAYSLRSQLHMLNDRMEEAIEWGEKALSVADRFGNVEAKIHALNNIGTAKIFRGNAGGVAQMRESLRLAIKHGQHEHAARVYTNLSEYAVEFRDFDLAEEVMAEGIAFDTEHDLVSWTHYLVGRQAQLRAEQGRLHDAETIAHGVLELPQLTLLMKLPALTTLGKARLRMGENDAGDILTEALTDATATDELQYIVPVRLCLIEYAWFKSDYDCAVRELKSLHKIGAANMHNWHQGEVAVWSKRLGADMLEACTGDPPQPHALELNGDHNVAAAAWRDLGAPFSAVLADLFSPDPEASVLSTCIKECRGMDARAGEAKAREIAAQHDLADTLPARRRGPYNASRSHPLGLTKKEQEILRLICEGENNITIAEQLSRSKKTIEHHASSIFRKMNVKNRMEAMLRVQNEPWLL